jgi:chlorophyll synthase
MSAGIVNDFKSMEGDRQFGLESIPILVGVERAKWLAALIPDTVQWIIAAYFWSIGETTTAAILAALVIPQVYFQSTLLFPDPVANDIKYVTMSQPFSVLSLFVAAMTIGQHEWLLP